MANMSGIENHPFNKDLFFFFDKNKDGAVDFNEFIIGLDIMERGTFDEKCAYCFEIYDIYGSGILDIVTLRHLLRRSYSEVIVELERIVKDIEEGQEAKDSKGITWFRFEKSILPKLCKVLPTSLDRMEFHK